MSREEKKRSTREALYGAALALFRERGYDAVSVHDITERAGTAKGTFFRHFPTKAHVIADWYEQQLTPRTRIAASFDEAMEIVLGEQLRLVTDDPELIRAKIVNESSSEAIIEAERRVDEALRQLIESTLPDMKALPARELAQLALCILTGAAREWRLEGSGTPIEALVRARIRSFRVLLEAAGLTPGGRAA